MTMPEPAATPGGAPTRIRTIAFNALAGLLGFLSAGVGILSIVGGLSVERTVHRLHDIGTGLLLVLLIAPAALALLGARRRSIAGMQQVAAVVIGSMVAGALSRTLDGVAVMMLVFTALLATLHPARGRLLDLPRRPSWALGLIAVAAALPLGVYAANEAALQRWTVPTNPHAAEMHYGGMAAMALALVLVALVAALRTDGWRVPARCAGITAAAYGLASLNTPYLESSFGTVGGALAVLGGIAFVAVAQLTGRREGLTGRVSGTSGRPLDQVAEEAHYADDGRGSHHGLSG